MRLRGRWKRLLVRLRKVRNREAERCQAVDPDGDFACTREVHGPETPHRAPIFRRWPIPREKTWGIVEGELSWFDAEDEDG